MDIKQIFNQRVYIAFINFLVVALIGAILRYVFVHEIKIVTDFKNVLHAHSHIAMMGWVFMALFGMMLYTFVPDQSVRKIYRILFWTNEINCLLLTVNFWLYGYNSLSIFLSAIYLVVSYLFIYNLLRDMKKNKHAHNPLAKRILHFALFFLFFSSLGILFIGPVLASLHGVQKVLWYYLLVQFYIHFNYNGWFTFGCLALFFSMSPVAVANFKYSVFPAWGLAICASVTYCLSVFWGFPGNHLYLNISIVAAVFQLYFTIQLFTRNKEAVIAIWKNSKQGVRYLFLIAFVALIIKQVLQIVIIYPEMAHASFVLRNYVIAYLHLSFLGVTTVFLIGYAWQKEAVIFQTLLSKIYVAVVVSSIFAIELLLSIMGSLSWLGKVVVPLFYELVFILSLSIVISVLFVMIINRKKIL